jgi:hypothetical protein
MIFSLGCLQAEENPSSQASSSASSPTRHVGVGNYYKMGTKENPVSANEHCAFLNSDERAMTAFYGPYFLDGTFMNCRFSPEAWGHCDIKENDCITRLNEHTYRYVVIPGRGDYTIDGLSGWSYYSVAANVLEDFNTWRKNPKAQEIVDYLNSKIEGRSGDAEKIISRYPDATISWEFLNLIASTAHDDQPYCLQLQLGDERNRPLITFSTENEETSFHEGLMHAVMVEGMEYYRPVFLKLVSKEHYQI